MMKSVSWNSAPLCLLWAVLWGCTFNLWAEDNDTVTDPPAQGAQEVRDQRLVLPGAINPPSRHIDYPPRPPSPGFWQRTLTRDWTWVNFENWPIRFQLNARDNLALALCSELCCGMVDYLCNPASQCRQPAYQCCCGSETELSQPTQTSTGRVRHGSILTSIEQNSNPNMTFGNLINFWVHTHHQFNGFVLTQQPHQQPPTQTLSQTLSQGQPNLTLHQALNHQPQSNLQQILTNEVGQQESLIAIVPHEGSFSQGVAFHLSQQQWSLLDLGEITSMDFEFANIERHLRVLGSESTYHVVILRRR